MRGLKGRLLEKSIEAYILALETINRLSIKYRVENFCYLICNAWELMLKAKLLHDGNNKRKVIFYSKKRGEPERSLSLRNCAGRIFTDASSPIRRNLELIEDLRDKSTHLILSKVPKEILGLFQANVLNYHRYLQEWFQISLSDRISVGMMTICYDFDPEEFDPNSKRLKRELGAETAKYLTKYQSALRKSFDEFSKSSEFSIDINYQVAIIKNLKDADISLVNGKTGTPTHVVKVAKNSSDTHPYRQKEVIEKFNEYCLKPPKKINQYDFQCIIRVLNIRSKEEFFYKGDVQGSPSQYSQAFIEFLVTNYNNDSRFFEKMREKDRESPDSSNEAITDAASFVPIL